LDGGEKGWATEMSDVVGSGGVDGNPPAGLGGVVASRGVPDAEDPPKAKLSIPINLRLLLIFLLNSGEPVLEFARERGVAPAPPGTGTSPSSTRPSMRG